jgi:hypothetical protein
LELLATLGAVPGQLHLLFSDLYGAFFAASPQKTGLSAPIFFTASR